MKTITNIIFPRRRQLPSLGLLLLTAVLLAFAPSSARAGGELPFHANFITQVESFVEYPFLHVTVKSRGQATYMGRTTAFTDDQLVSLIDGSATATYKLTGVKGDTLILAMTFQSTEVAGGVTFAGSYTVAGGSGQFEGATGSGLLSGGALFLTETDGIGAFAVAGTISAPDTSK
jgi:hypothetical protein